jgi:predicted transcriptional regulator
VYSAAASEVSTQRRLVSDLLDRAFDGSARELIQQALSGRAATRNELNEIRQLLDDIEKDHS